MHEELFFLGKGMQELKRGLNSWEGGGVVVLSVSRVMEFQFV